MLYIDNRFNVSDKNIRTVSSSGKIKKTVSVSAPLKSLSESGYIDNLKFKAHIKSVYEDICNKIDLNEQIRPNLEFDTMGAGAAGGFDNLEGKIYFDDKFLKQLSDKTIVFAIRHELQHVKQFHNMVRMLGIEKFEKLMACKDENCTENKSLNFEKINVEYYRKVEQVLGKINKDSPDGMLTQKYIDAYKKYPDLIKLWQRTDVCMVKKIFIFVKEVICNYKFNFLEIDANKAAKIFLKTFKNL